MLCLSRKVGQKTILQTSDGPVTITVLAVRSGSTIQLGIEAPGMVAIHREEIIPRLKPASREVAHATA